MPIILILSLALAGCATGPTYDYKKPDTTMQDKKRDWAKCYAQGGQARGDNYRFDMDRYIRTCMEGEGWESFIYKE
jgi:hypothetical protein